jgi:uncharacterized membrane protein
MADNEQHPVQAMVYSIVSLVLIVASFAFSLSSWILGIVYQAIKQANQTSASDLRVVQEVYLPIIIVFGLFALAMGIVSIFLAKEGRLLGEVMPDDGRAKSAVIMGKIGYILGFVTAGLGLLSFVALVLLFI